jgi:hypothetical protein
VLVTAPSGSASVIVSALVASTVAAGQRILVLAHRREIIDHTVSKCQCIHYLARRIHLYGERCLVELFIELDADANLHSALERYARIAPLAGFVRALGGDRLAGPRAVSGGWG